MKKQVLTPFLLLLYSILSFGQVATKPGFYVSGRFLYDRYGEKTILRGVNEMSVWAGADPTGATYMPEIRKTGTNCVRIVWTMNPANSLNTLDQLIQNCVKSNMIPMVEIHDATGNFASLPSVFTYWVRADVVALIKKHEHYLLVNIANEAGDGSETDVQFRTAYATGIQSMRTAGIHTNIVVDANEWGQKLQTLNNTANFILNADPDHNVMFSVHTYWSIFTGNTTAVVKAKLQSAVDAGYCLIIGEFNKYGGWGGAANLSCSAQGVCDYATMIEECQKHGIGWLTWSWGTASNTGGGNALCTVMDMAPGGQYTALQAGWATEVALTSPYSIKNTSVTPKSMFWLTRPLIVPEYENGLVKLYQTDNPTPNPTYTLNVGALCGGAGKSNGVALNGNDLYVNVKNSCGRIYKFANYLNVGNAAVVTMPNNYADDYIGINFDNAGNMYSTERHNTDGLGWNLVKYVAPYGNANRTVMGNGGSASAMMSNIAFDAARNIWVSDNQNERIVVYKSDGSGYRVLANYTGGNIAVANTNTALQTLSARVFARPEGLDFDGSGNLWVGNNNDVAGNTRTTIVKISTTILNGVLGTGAGGSYTLTAGQANQANGYSIYNVPNSANGKSQCGGLIIDKPNDALYVNEEVGHKGFKFDMANIANIVDVYNPYTIDIVSTNPGNGGICFGNTVMPIVLPVELLALKATPSVSGVNLTWQTALEAHTLAFDIERSTDGREFEKIGATKALGKATTYQFLDETPPAAATLYYRLKIKDLEGKSRLSKTVAVEFKSKSTPLSIFPNPADKTVTILLPTDDRIITALTITDVLGKVVFSKRIATQLDIQPLDVDVSSFAKGLYIVKIGGVAQRLMVR